MNPLFKNVLVIIPARQGSKRLPGKNVKLLDGKPLISYSIEYALSQISDADILVSTNDPNIVAIANEYDVSIHHRTEALSQDDTPTSAVLQNVVQSIKMQYRHVVLLQPTNPLRPKNLFKESYKRLLKIKGDSLLCVSTNRHKLGKIENDIFLPSTYSFGQRSQDLDALYYENGLMYISDYKLIEKGQILSNEPVSMLLDHPFATVDIDSELDFKWAEYIKTHYND